MKIELIVDLQNNEVCDVFVGQERLTTIFKEAVGEYLELKKSGLSNELYEELQSEKKERFIDRYISGHLE